MTEHASGFFYPYPRPMVTVDTVVFRRKAESTQALLIRRGNPPFQGLLALPGGFVDMDEDLKDAARRELSEETGLQLDNLVQIGTFGKPGRDPRGRNITVVYAGILDRPDIPVRGGDDATEALWIEADHPPDLAFDHKEILAFALAWFQRDQEIGD